MKNKYYDCVFSLGEACFIAIGMKHSNIRKFSGPFDWMYGATFQTRCEMLCNKFENYMNEQDFEFLYYRENYTMCAYKNKFTQMVFNHDFYARFPFKYQFPAIKEKYQRRINRLIKKIENGKNILIIYGNLHDSANKQPTKEELIYFMQRLNEIYSPAKVDLLYINYDKKMQDNECRYEVINDTITICHCHSANRNSSDYTGNKTALKNSMSYIKIKHTQNDYIELLHRIKNRITRFFYKYEENENCIRTRILCFKFKKQNLLLEYVKKKYVLENKKNIKNLVLGSSHGNRGLNPLYINMPTVNMATTSQDLYQTLELCKYGLKKQKHLENIILFYAPFSAKFNIQHSSEKYRSAILEKAFNIKPLEKPDKKTLGFYKEIKNPIKQSYELHADFNPLFGKIEEAENIIKQRAEKHSNFTDDMTEFLSKLNILTKENNISLYIVIPPVTGVYKNYLLNKDKFIKEINDFCSKNNVRLVSFFDDPSFTAEDFYDCDHLNNNGATKLSLKINEILTASGEERWH